MQFEVTVAALEDKIVQKAAVELLSSIYEQYFLDCSYGFRPGRGAQDALDEVGRAICREPTSVVLELDIASYFDSIVREHLMEMIEQRISDASVLRLIRKWINVGVIDDGRLLVSETGTGQGQIISPLLANVYLHFVLDEWFEREVKPRLRGKAFEIRYADDAVICFQYREDAEKVLQVLPKRFARYGLTLHPEKTRLVEFGRTALARAIRAGTKPDTFDFLGLTHKCALSRRGKFTVHVKTMKKRLRRSFKAVAEWCRTHRHDAVDKQQAILNAKLRGHYQYYGRPTREKSYSRKEAGSRPKRLVGKAADTDEETGKCSLWDRRGTGSSISGKIFRITSGRTRWQQGLVATCPDSSHEAKCRRRGEPDGFGA